MSQISTGLKYLIIGGAIALITLMFPRTQFNLNFVKGQKWQNEDLVSEFNFTVPKDQAIIDGEITKIKTESLPVFISSESPADQVFDKVQNLATSYPDSLIFNELEIRALLERVYKRGVLSDEYYQKYSGRRISVLSDGLMSATDVNSFVTVRSVKKELTEKLVASENFTKSISIPTNISYSEDATQSAIDEKVTAIDKSGFEMQKGNLIIRKGDLVDSERFKTLSAYKSAFAENNSDNRSPMIVFMGYFLLTCLIIGALIFYLISYFPAVYENNRKLLFILTWPILFGFIVTMVESGNGLSSYLIPFCIVPILIKNFYSDRLALFVHIVVILIASFISKLGYEFTFIQILVGIVVILFTSQTRYWNKFFVSLGIILGTYLLSYLGLSLIKVGSFMDLDWYVFPWLALNVLLCLLAYPFIPIIERIFGFTSDITLTELSDMSKPLLKEMSLKAPGTLQHSLQVSNLAEAATDKIGGNSLLVKVAALYHDIGKIEDSQYFIENQSGGNNPHDSLNNIDSARKIIGHVTGGIELAKKNRLPEIIIDFIKSHHGTTRVEYFYRNHVKENPEHNFDESLFRYPGPKPVSKEETILMMADSIEAASKSLKNPTGQDIDLLVDKIIQYKLDQGQFDDSKLNFDDLEKCKATFKSLLRNIYHVRVEYPDAPTPSA